MLSELKAAAKAPMGSLLAVAIGGTSIYVVWKAGMSFVGGGDGAATVIAICAVISVLYSMMCVGLFQKRKAMQPIVAWLFLIGLPVFEGTNILGEAVFFYGNFLASETTSQVEQAAVSANIAVIEKGRNTLDDLKTKRFRSEKQIQADINAALARKIDLGYGSSQPLAKLTKNCTDATVSWYSDCTEVFKLQGELAASQQAVIDFDKAKADVTTYTVDTSKITAPADARAIIVAALFGTSRNTGALIAIAFSVLVLTIGRITIGPALIDPVVTASKPDNLLAAVTSAPAGAVQMEPDIKPDRLTLISQDPDPDPTTPRPPRRKDRTREPSALPGVLLGIRKAETAARATALLDAPTGNVEAFYEQRTKPDKTAVKWHAAPAGKFRKAYLEWCRDNGFQPVGGGLFRQESLRFVQKSGKIGGNYRYQGRSIAA